jgi:tyrosine-protein phosphatase OCA6
MPSCMASDSVLVPPLRFAAVAPGVYKGSHPRPRSLIFLETLNLRTLVSLTPCNPLSGIKAHGGGDGSDDDQNAVYQWMLRVPEKVWNKVNKAKKGEAVEVLSRSTVRQVVEVKRHTLHDFWPLIFLIFFGGGGGNFLGLLLQILVNPAYHPVYIHALDGADVEALVVGCLRKLQCWSMASIEAELTRSASSSL